jgi:urate oxidase
MASDYTYEISYGKLHVPLYRVYARPLTGVASIPESAFTGRDNTLFAVEVDVEVFGDSFLLAYTVGDNSRIVATDTMKNVVLRQALAYDGATLEGFLDHLGRYFLATYSDMERLRITVRQMPFVATTVPTGEGFAPSTTLFSHMRGEYATASLDMLRGADDGQARLIGHSCGLVGMQLLKVTGSAFTHFVRDANTTLPERGDRPLFVHMDVGWLYHDAADMLVADHARYVPVEQVRDLVQTVFSEFVSESIQHLVHEMGTRLLRRFPQLEEVSFEAQNRTPDPVAVSDSDEKVKVYSAPFPAFGLIRLAMWQNKS